MNPTNYLYLSALLFSIGAVGVIVRRNAIVVFMCIELMLNAANLQFAAAAVHHGDTTGWVYTLFAIAIAASEVAIGLAIFLAMYGKHESITLDDVNVLKN